MATRTRKNWKPDSRGYYARQIGWERSKSGNLQQHKFLLGTDRKEVERRERKLRELWDTFSGSRDEDRPLWPDDLLIVAKRIAKGIPDVPVPRGPNEKQHQYAANYLGARCRLFKWLDTSSAFDWTKPVAFSDLDTRIRRLPSDHARRSLEQVETFSLAELRLLMRYGQPFDRLLLLLGLNCGFGRAEIASLLIGEVELFKGHSEREQEILGYTTTDEDSFIKRVRRKSGVYGEHILFPMTVEGIEWALEQRERFPGFADDARLVLSEKGTPLDKQTKSGNANQLIPNHFARLVKRIQEDDNEIRPLSFGKLRKTASDPIKRHSDGEIACKRSRVKNC